MPTVITYPQAKAAVAAANYPVSSGSDWQGKDAGSYDKFSAAASYNAGVPFDRRASQYGFAYPAVMPTAIANAVIAAYSVTIAASPLAGNQPLTVTATATETGGAATNFNWNWGDGTITNTAIATATHSYTVPGTYTVKMTPTIGGVIVAQVSAPTPVVISGVYSATLAGAPLSAAHTTPVVWTLTETNNPTGTDSYLWDFGDSTTITTAVPNATHTYAAAGTYTAKVTPTINGVAKTQVTAAAPAVLT